MFLLAGLGFGTSGRSRKHFNGKPTKVTVGKTRRTRRSPSRFGLRDQSQYKSGGVPKLPRDWKRTREKVSFTFAGNSLNGFVKPNNKKEVLEILARAEKALTKINQDEVQTLKSYFAVNQIPLENIVNDLINFFHREGIEIAE